MFAIKTIIDNNVGICACNGQYGYWSIDLNELNAYNMPKLVLFDTFEQANKFTNSEYFNKMLALYSDIYFEIVEFKFSF